MTEFQPIYVINAIVFAFLGIAIFVVTFLVLDKLTPYDLWREICEHKNLALAVMLGSMSIGLCIIIAAAVH
jgi:putative membrane protein